MHSRQYLSCLELNLIRDDLKSIEYSNRKFCISHLNYFFMDFIEIDSQIINHAHAYWLI